VHHRHGPGQDRHPLAARGAGRGPPAGDRAEAAAAGGLRLPAEGSMTSWPDVGVLIPTRDRPAQLRAALAAVRAQDYPGRVRTVIVHDRSEPDRGLAGHGRVQVLVNHRTPGLAGARNTGVLALDTELVAFCD